MGPAIAVVIHSVDPSLISRLIHWSEDCANCSSIHMALLWSA